MSVSTGVLQMTTAGLVPLIPSQGITSAPPPNPSLFARTDAAGRHIIDPKAASDAIDAARAGYAEALAHYDGTVEALVQMSHPKLQPYLRLYRIRELAPVVDLVVEALTIGRTAFANENAEKIYTEQVWEACQMGRRVVPEALHLSCLYGDSIIYSDIFSGKLRKTVLDPRTARMLKDPASGEDIALVQQQPLEGGGSALEVMTAAYLARYEDRRVGGVAAGTWQLVGFGPNPAGRITAVHLTNVQRRGYGSPEHAKAYSMAIAAAKLWATFQLLMETAALPMTVILDKAKEADGVGVLPGGKPKGDPEAPPISLDPGAIVRAVGDSLAKIGGDDGGGFLAALDHIKVEICRLTSTPEDEMTDSQISGISRREKRKRFTTKVKARQRDFGVALADDAELSMFLLGLDGGRASIEWEAADPLDVTEVWDIATKQRAAGVPLRDALQEAGWEPEAIAKATANNAIETGVAIVAALTPEAVEAFAAAVTTFADAVERGEADPAQLAALLAVSAAAAKASAEAAPQEADPAAEQQEETQEQAPDPQGA